MSLMKRSVMVVVMTAMGLGLMVIDVCGGSLDSPAAPTDPASAMYTAQDIYDRLATGTNAPKRSGVFTEPATGPTAGAMPTTDEIMAQAPERDNAAGAVPADVLSGKTFWGLTEGAWGTRTGTIATRTLLPANDTLEAGYYEATTLSAVDADLAAANIRHGTVVFGHTGTLRPALGDATAAQVLEGQTFTINNSEQLTGTMVNHSDRGFIPGTGNVTIPFGFYNGSGVVTGDAALVTGNIRAGVTIFGVGGKTEVVDTASGDAVAGEIMAGKKAWVDGTEVTGTMANVGQQNVTPGISPQTITQGYHDGTGSVAGDAALVTGNIKKDVEVFGVMGTYEGEVIYTNVSAGVPKTGQTNSYRNGDDGYHQVGVAWPDPQFTVQANTNLVVDNMTGLMWVRAPHDLPGNDVSMEWENAIDFCNGLDFAGHTDWRLPNIRELLSLIDYGEHHPALPFGHPFTGVQLDRYWSSSTSEGGTVGAWDLYLSYGGTGTAIKSTTYYVWPVRAGQ